MPRDPRQADLIEAPSRSILDVVKEELAGFKYRHRDRLARRKQTNEKKRLARRQRKTRGAVQKSLTLEDEVSNVRTIKVTYRSIQEQPQGVLNPSNFKIPGPRPVEVFQKGDKWKLREMAIL